MGVQVRNDNDCKALGVPRIRGGHGAIGAGLVDPGKPWVESRRILGTGVCMVKNMKSLSNNERV